LREVDSSTGTRLAAEFCAGKFNDDAVGGVFAMLVHG
jgi:hypothetical protein